MATRHSIDSRPRRINRSKLMTGSLISVVVPAYNAEDTIGPCIHALRNQQFEQPYEIIVVDDGSTAKTPEIARDAGATVISIVNSRPAAARNTGIRVAKGDTICFTDADCVSYPDWLREITAPLEDTTVVACKGIYSSRQTQLIARFVQLEYEDKYDLMRGAETIDFIDTYSAAYRREILVAEGGFDEQYAFQEDQELSFRLAERGHRMVFQPTAVVEHRHPSTLIAYIRKKYLIGYWKSQIVRRFPNRLVRDSHTPQIMKVQMALAILLLAASTWFIVGALLSIMGRRPLGTILYGPLLVLASIFVATALPFVRKAWSKDTSVALASPLLLFARALSLGFGYIAGVISPRDHETNPSRSIKTSYPTKRVLDVIGSVVGLIFTVIVWPLVALLIKLDSVGTVIFRQERIGVR